MSWDDIRYFLAVMRGGSLSAAARALQVQHSTVARRIDALESALGIRLFDRLPRGWPPTDEGLHLAEHAARIETDAHAFARAAGAAALDGVVRVSASPVFASHFLAPRLARAQRAWPALRIDLLGEMHAANLYAREADLAVRLSRPTEPGPPRAGSARCASRCARRRNGRTRRPTPGRSSATTTRSRKRRSTSGSPASLPGAVSRSSPTTGRAASRVRGRRRRRAAAAVSRRRAGRACRRAARRADGRTALRHRARDLARGPPGRAPVAARAACRRRDRRSRSRGGRTAVGSCLRTRLCHARQRPA